MKIKLISVKLVSAWVFLLVAGPLCRSAPACGPYYFEILDFNPAAADYPEQFLGGELGVFQAEYSSADLWLAYRHLNGLSVPEERFAEAQQWQLAEQDRQQVEAWRLKSAELRGGSNRPRIHRWKSVRRESNGYEYYDHLLNCTVDAFRSAVQLLESLTETLASDSEWLKEWIHGQDAVFALCSGEGPAPKAAAADWPAFLRAERRYQIAAAQFYDGSFDQAEESFRALALDSDFARRDLADYLVARTLARAGKVKEAVAHLENLLQRPERQSIHHAARRLKHHFEFRLDPAGALRRVASELSAATLGPGNAQALIDFDRALKRLRAHQELPSKPWLPPAGESKGDDLTAWVQLLRLQAAYRLQPARDLPTILEHALAHGGAHWWLATAMIWHGGDRPRPDLPPELEAEVRAELLSNTPDIAGPGAMAVAYYRLALALASEPETRTDLAAEIAGWMAKASGPSDSNRFQLLYREVGEAPKAYWSRSLLKPAAGSWDGMEILGVEELIEDHFGRLPVERFFESQAIEQLNRLTPLGLLELARYQGAESVPTAHGRRLALVAWARGVLTEQWQWARQESDAIADLLETEAPALARDLRAFAAAPEDEAPFVAARLFLNSPGVEPMVHRAEGWPAGARSAPATGFGWWCRESLTQSLDSDRRQITPAQGRRIDYAPLALAPWIFDYADRRPDDPRVAETLHLLVKSTRRTCAQGNGLFGEVSKKAFQRLHRQYPSSPWTAKTPYWFD